MTRSRRLLFLSTLLLAMPAVAHAQWDTPNRAFHKATAFPLEGAHQSVACASCHVGGVTKGTPTSCESCHWQRRQDDVYRLRLGSNCAQCHKTTAWTAVKWDHGAMTGMTLNVSHKTVGCDGCHKSAQFSDVKVSCLDCHQKDYQATKAPNHLAAGFPATCQNCHRASDTLFTQAQINHSQFYPLVGLHATAACAACHVKNIFKGTSKSCVACHTADYTQSKNPNHIAAGFSTACDSCHRNSDTSWAKATFNHTAFPIASGRHAGLACATCHTNSTSYALFSCTGCHDKPTTDPKHKGVTGYQWVSSACYACHPQGKSFD